MIEVILNDRLGKKIRVKCNEDDTIGDLKKMVAAQTGTRADKIRIQKWYTVYKDHITLDDYEVHDGMNLLGMDQFMYPGLGPAAANPWAFLQQQPGLQPQVPQQPFQTTGATAALGAPAGGGSQAMAMLPGLMQQHMQQVRQQQAQQQQQQQQQPQPAGAWAGMQGCQLPANFMPNGLTMPDGSGARANGYPAAAPPMALGGQHVAYSALRGQSGLPFGANQQQQQPGHQLQAMLHQQAYGGQLHTGQVPLEALHGAGVPTGFLAQPQFGGGGGSTMIPSAMVQSGMVPDAVPLPSSKADGGAQVMSPPLRRQEVATPQSGGGKPRPASGLPADRGRRHNAQIDSHGWAGQVVWAKLAKYPWWPAQVLAGDDPYIPAGSEAPRRGAVPVRFFGTYDFSWIESQRMLQPFQEGLAEKSQQPDEDGFAASVQEAQTFLTTGALPEGFELALLEQDDDELPPSTSPITPKPAVTPAKRKASTAGAAGDGAQPKARSRNRATAKPQARKRDPAAVQDELQKIRRSMALEAPAESPFANVPCLDGLLQLVGQA